jgi:hypothetical protein
MLEIKIPNICQNEQLYVIKVLLKDFLGIDFKVEVYEGNNIEITKIDNFSKLILDASFFNKAMRGWLQHQSMPVLPLEMWVPEDDGIEVNLTDPRIPVLYGSPGVVRYDNHLHLNLDVFGSIFFMLSRYEELVIKERDQHDRFSAFSSYAYKNNFLMRPLVDEYVEILKKCLKMLWPDLKFKKREFSIDVSHDVDQLSRYQTRKNLYQYLRALGGDLMKGHIKDFIYSPLSYFNKNIELNVHDPYNTFDWLMDISDKNNLKSTFNFICGKSENYNADYDIEDLKVKNLIKKINYRGHLIGLHPSYDCYLNPELIKRELNKLKNSLNSFDIKQKDITSRMHYLRWKTPDTLVNLNNLGIKRDTSLGYAEHVGFRCGTCHSYQGYDLVNHKKLDIIIDPLIIMDGTLFDKKYMNLKYNSAFNFATELKKKCKKMNGQFNILWHNSYFQDLRQKKFYQNLIQN